MDEAKKKELEAKYGEIVVVETTLGTAAFKTPDEHQIDRWFALANAKKFREASKHISMCAVVEPSREVFEEWLRKKPLLVTRCAKPVLVLAGADPDTGE